MQLISGQRFIARVYPAGDDLDPWATTVTTIGLVPVTPEAEIHPAAIKRPRKHQGSRVVLRSVIVTLQGI